MPDEGGGKRGRYQRFVDMVPEPVREQAQELCDERAAARREFSKRKQTAARVDWSRRGEKVELQHHDIDVAERTDRAQQVAAEVSREQYLRGVRKPRGSSKRSERREKFAKRGERIGRREKAHVLRYQQKLRELGQWDAAPLSVPAFVHRRAQLIMADPTGHTARVFLATLPPAVARRTRRCALEPTPYRPRRVAEGRTLYEPSGAPLSGRASLWQQPGRRFWEHPAAIRAAASACVLWHLRRPTKRRGFAAVTRGIPRALVAALLQDPKSGHRPAVTTLYGHSRGVAGAVRSLEGALFQINQPPGDRVRPCDRGPSGHAFNVYWFFPWVGTPQTEVEAADSEAAAGILAELGLDTSATGPPQRAATGPPSAPSA